MLSVRNGTCFGKVVHGVIGLADPSDVLKMKR
jgi:hypothetical protein